MPLKISAGLKKAISEEQKIPVGEAEDYVWNHKSQHCFLCGGELNRASDVIELDHDEPTAEGGSDGWKNLNLTHAGCNRYKRNHSSIEVRPHLKFKRFWDENLGSVNFAGAKQFYTLAASTCYMKISGDAESVKIETELGSQTVPVYSEKMEKRQLQFCFVELPISCVLNDDQIQPRNININHLLSIAADLTKNPLHEQPACRVVGDGDEKKVLMFDGQHKTVANLINGRTSLVFKIYLNITIDEAIHLVNSIQSRIKKLPLTPFELATKMSDEVVRQIDAYEEEVGSQQVSEDGFINWLDAADRNRAKKGIESAVLDRIISNEDLAFRKIIERKGLIVDGPVSLKEAAFQNHLLKRLLHTAPLPVGFKGEAMKQARERESNSVIKLLNMIYERGFVIQDEAEPEAEKRRIERVAYQASLSYMSAIFRQLMSAMLLPSQDKMTFIEKDISEDNWERMGTYIDRFFGHPVWTADLTKGANAKAVQEALSKNQNVDSAFLHVGLTGGYCANHDKLQTNWAGV